VRRLVAAALTAGCFLGAGTGAGADKRSTVRFEYSCESDLGGRDVTLFANGTVRLREGPWDHRELYLDELLPEELESTLRRLEDIHRGADRRSTSLPTAVAEGGWVGRCQVRLALAGAEEWSYSFSDYEVAPLEVSSLVHLADHLAEGTRPPAGRERIPAGYEPERGDVLRTAEGQRFEVIRPTTDGRGIELRGLDSPVSIFVARDAILEAFAVLETGDEEDGGTGLGLPAAPEPIDP